MLPLKYCLLALCLSSALGFTAAAQDFAAPFKAELEARAEVEAIEQQVLPPEELWQGTDGAMISALLGTTRPEALPPTARTLLIDLLQTQNRPAGAGNDFLANRMTLLGRMGALSAVASLSATGLDGPNGPVMAEGYIGALLLNGALEAACEAQRKLETAVKQGAHWARLEAVCFLLDDQTTQANFALEIAAEAGIPDPLFDTLYSALVEGASSVEDLPPLSEGHAFSAALQLAMAHAAGLDLSRLGVTPNQMLTRPLLARATGTPLATRIQAAEQAVMAGQLSADNLGALYADAYALMHQEGEIDLPDVIQDAALHYNVIQNPQTGLISGPAIAAALREAQERGTLPAVARLYAGAAAEQDSSLATEEDAALIARGLLSIGEFATAKPWFMLSYEAARTNTPGAFAHMNRAWPLIAMAEDGTAPSGIQKLAAGWLTTLKVAEDDAARRKAVLLFTLLEGFGRPVDEDLWATLLPGDKAAANHSVDHTLWRGMEAAAARGERGLALMLLLNGLSQANIADHHPAYIASAVNTLIEIGMEQEGHRLAVDALLAAGF